MLYKILKHYTHKNLKNIEEDVSVSFIYLVVAESSCEALNKVYKEHLDSTECLSCIELIILPEEYALIREEDYKDRKHIFKLHLSSKNKDTNEKSNWVLYIESSSMSKAMSLAVLFNIDEDNVEETYSLSNADIDIIIS